MLPPAEEKTLLQYLETVLAEGMLVDTYTLCSLASEIVQQTRSEELRLTKHWATVCSECVFLIFVRLRSHFSSFMCRVFEKGTPWCP